MDNLIKKKKKRIKLPTDTEATVLFKEAHTCAICNDSGLEIQINHIDGNPSNNNEENLIVVCTQHHAKISSKSSISKGFTKKELIKYKYDWEEVINRRRHSLADPMTVKMVRFDGQDINTVYLETESGVLRAFQDPYTLEFMGFNWGNIDVYPDEFKKQFIIEEPLTVVVNCKKIRLKFSNGTIANEVYLIWDDGRKHHIPDPDTLDVLGGTEVEELKFQEFNAIPHGKPLLSIYSLRWNLAARGAFDDIKIKLAALKSN